ncbi:MAG: VOC family protein [Patescibacteria group bacterium]
MSVETFKRDKELLTEYYTIRSNDKLQQYFELYIPLIKHYLGAYGIDIADSRFEGDHLGFQVHSAAEFEACDEILKEYSTLIKDSVIHERRNRVYEFKVPLEAHGVQMPRIEIFEPKPGADLPHLKPGIDHIALYVRDFDDFVFECKDKKVPIDKMKTFEEGSTFFKTVFYDLVEVEFRNDRLGVNM